MPATASTDPEAFENLKPPFAVARLIYALENMLMLGDLQTGWIPPLDSRALLFDEPGRLAALALLRGMLVDMETLADLTATDKLYERVHL